MRTLDLPPLLSKEQAIAQDERFEKYRKLASKGGDVTRGKSVALACTACHLIRGEGNSIGPDLSGVGAMGLEAILRNILTPNAAMENGYRIYRVELMNGDLVEAFLVREENDAVIVRVPGSRDRRIPKKEISSAQFLRRSLMPEGLLDALQPDQVSDLFTYLMSLK